MRFREMHREVQRQRPFLLALAAWTWHRLPPLPRGGASRDPFSFSSSESALCFAGLGLGPCRRGLGCACCVLRAACCGSGRRLDGALSAVEAPRLPDRDRPWKATQRPSTPGTGTGPTGPTSQEGCRLSAVGSRSQEAEEAEGQGMPKVKDEGEEEPKEAGQLGKCLRVSLHIFEDGWVIPCHEK